MPPFDPRTGGNWPTLSPHKRSKNRIVLVREEIEALLDTHNTFDPAKLVIQPLPIISENADNQLGPAGIDLRLDTRFRKLDPKRVTHIVLSQDYDEYEAIELSLFG